MNCKINSQEVYCNPLFQKGIVNTPMNTIMSPSLGFDVPVITDNTTVAIMPCGKQPAFILKCIQLWLGCFANASRYLLIAGSGAD